MAGESGGAPGGGRASQSHMHNGAHAAAQISYPVTLGNLVADQKLNRISCEDRKAHVEPRVMDLFVHLATQEGDVVSRQSLLDDVWGRRHGGDESLTRAVSQLRKAFREIGACSDHIETVPKRGYRLVRLIGEEGADDCAICRPHETPAPVIAPGRAAAERKFRQALKPTFTIVAGLAILSAALLVFAGLSERKVISDAAPVEFEIVAVGSISAAPTDKTLTPFASALTRDIRAHLTRSAGIRPVAANVDAPFRLTGVAESGDTAPSVLIELTARGVGVWAKRFEQSSGDLEALRAQSAAATASILNCAMRFASRPDDRTPMFFSLLMRHCETLVGSDTVFSGHISSGQLLAAKPDDPRWMGHHALMLYFAGTQAMRPDVADNFYAEASQLAAQTRAIDAGNIDALAVPVLIKRDAAGLAARLDTLGRLYEEPGPDEIVICNLYSHTLRMAGRYHDALRVHQRLAAIDPLSDRNQVGLAWLLALNGQQENAARILDQVARRNPGLKDLHQRRFEISLLHGDPNEALAQMSGTDSFVRRFSDTERSCYQAVAEARLTSAPTAPASFETCNSIRQADIRARYFAAMGQIDWAYEAANELKFNESNDGIFMFYPEMRAFRRDARFWPLAHRAGLAQFWLETDLWPDFCTEPDLPYDCRQEAARVVAVHNQRSG